MSKRYIPPETMSAEERLFVVPYRQKVYEELEDLSLSISNLISYTTMDAFNALDSIDQNLLLDQVVAMQDYQAILEKRIARFKVM